MSYLAGIMHRVRIPEHLRMIRIRHLHRLVIYTGRYIFELLRPGVIMLKRSRTIIGMQRNQDEDNVKTQDGPKVSFSDVIQLHNHNHNHKAKWHFYYGMTAP